jgi:exopolysaccharide biosynthesis WecB/TagA/CpsF family protein
MTTLLGLAFADLGLEQAASRIAGRAAGEPFRYVVTPNADHLVRLQRSPALWPVYRDAWLCLLDSRVVARLARLLGLPAPPVTPGSDLTELLLTRHVRPGERITIAGLAPDWLPALMARHRLAPPAHHNPPPGFERDPAAFAAAVAFVCANPARFVLLAVGSPRQELLAHAILATGRATGTGLCIGASLDFLSGARRRAPAWMRQAGLEWLHRLASDPRRLWRRYLTDSPAIIAPLLRARAAQAHRGTSA